MIFTVRLQILCSVLENSGDSVGSIREDEYLRLVQSVNRKVTDMPSLPQTESGKRAAALGR